MTLSKSLVLVVEDDPAMLRCIRPTLEVKKLDRQTGGECKADW